MFSKFTKLGAATFALLTTSLAANAADMPVKGPYYKAAPRAVISYYNWTGFYAGINGGYGWGTSNWDSPAEVGSKPKGGLIGGTIGYNYQMGAIVLGLEGDVDYSMIKESTTCALGPCDVENKWLGTARGRIGYAFDRWLPYLTGGAAFGDVKATRAGIAAGGASNVMTGWTVGAGLEYAFLGNWTTKLEYLYVDLGKFDCGTACGATPDNVTFKSNIIRAGLNYKFSGPIFSRF